MKWVSYTRMTSYKKNAEIPKNTIPLQNEAIQEYMKNHGWRVVKKYCDRKDSADATEYFNRMVEDGVRREFDGIVFDSVYHFGRSFGLLKEILQETFFPAGIQFAVVEDDFCSIGKTREEVDAFFTKKKGEFYGVNIRESRIESNLKGILILNQWHYGYIISDDRTQYLLDEEAAGVIKVIFMMFLGGAKFAQIAKRLDELHIDRPEVHHEKIKGCDTDRDDDKHWKGNVVKEILSCRMYTGEWSIKTDGPDIPMNVPAIISREVFDKAQSLISASYRPGVYNGRPENYLLSRKVYDKKTGKALSCRSCQDDPERLVYIKRGVKKPAVEDAKRNYIDQEEVLGAIREFLVHEKDAALNVWKKIGSDEKEKAERESLEKTRSQARDLYTQLITLCNERMDRHIAHDNKKISEEDFINGEAQYDNRSKEIEAQFKKVMKEADKVRLAFSDHNKWLNLFVNIELPEEMTREYLSKYISRVDIEDYENIEIIPQNNEWKEKLPSEWLAIEQEA